MRQALNNLLVLIGENNASVDCDRLPTVMADSTQMVQLIQNEPIKVSESSSPT